MGRKTNWNKVNQNMAGFAASMQNIYKMRQTTAENKAESAEDTKKAIKGVYDDEFKRVEKKITYYNNLINQATDGKIYGKEKNQISHWNKLRERAYAEQGALLEQGHSMVDFESGVVSYGDDVYKGIIFEGSEVDLGTQLVQEQDLDGALKVAESMKSMEWNNRKEMGAQFKFVESEVDPLRIKKAKWDEYKAEKATLNSAQKDINVIFREYQRLAEIKNRTEKEEARHKEYQFMYEKQMVFNEAGSSIKVQDKYQGFDNLKAKYKDGKNIPKEFTETDREIVERYSNAAKRIIKLNNPEITDEELSQIDFLSLKADNPMIQQYVDFMFDDSYAKSINEIVKLYMDRQAQKEK
jgi:hypothetical protein